MKLNLNKVHASKVFYGYIYPVFAKEFLFGSDYEIFAITVSEKFKLTPEQWCAILTEWELKELILSDKTEGKA